MRLLALGLSGDLNPMLGRTDTGYVYETLDALGSTLDLIILRSLGDRAGEHLVDVQRLYLTGKDVIDQDLKPLTCAKLPRRLELIHTSITDAGIGILADWLLWSSLPSRMPDITDGGLRSILASESCGFCL